MKRTKRNSIAAMAMALVLSFVAFLPAYAEELAADDAVGQTAEGIEPRVSTGKTVTDSSGNRYKVTGTAMKAAGSAVAGTSFNVTYYYGGTKADVSRVNGYAKDCWVMSKVTLFGGGENMFGNRKDVTGKSGSCDASEAYIYTVLALESAYGFNCNGGSITFKNFA